MDIEQLKMILDAACIILVLIFFAVKIIGRFITDNSEAEKLRMAAGVSHSWSEYELGIACSILRKHFKEEVKKQGGVW